MSDHWWGCAPNDSNHDYGTFDWHRCNNIAIVRQQVGRKDKMVLSVFLFILNIYCHSYQCNLLLNVLHG